ncbi:MAG: hypothetical protein H8E44_26825 [Planctomycetes bacterium]|nr:hypothetical protein [Planctomycetota bacterium]MBL7042808.1 hypothetical protein [Pirellulaceae bacterium]
MQRFLAIMILPLTGLVLPGSAQETIPSFEDSAGQEEPFDFLDGLDTSTLGGMGSMGDSDILLSATLMVEQDGRKGKLEVKATLAPHWHTYAMDQEGGPGPSKIAVKSTDKIEMLAPFQPDRQPKVREVEEFDVPLREHYEEVVWSAPVRLADGVDAETLELEAQFDGLICNDATGCKPIFGRIVSVAFGGYYEPTEPAGEYRSERSHATIRGHIQPAIVRPGDTMKLVLTAESDADWHVYAYASQDPDETSKPTLIVLKEPSSWSLDTPQPSAEPTVKELIPDEPQVRYHDGSVTWTSEISVPEGVADGDYDLSGVIGYQTCTDRSCDRPTAAEFAVRVTVGDGVTDEQRPLTFAASSYGEAARLAAAPVHSDQTSPSGILAVALWLLGILAVAFLGGFILNFMPCVLPVIGLKMMSLVHQAGESRSRIFSLNLWYSLGILSVFMVFATVAVVVRLVIPDAATGAVGAENGASLSWGAWLGDARIAIPLYSLVFALGLSLVGVWDIPILGFAGSGRTSELAEREGPLGAIFKGALTTILATPCTGPFVLAAVGFAVTAPPLLAYFAFGVMALGMASPYLLIGAFPKLISWLPKPGEWMETFKQVMGFVLMGTGVWIASVLHTAVPEYVIPILILTLALGFSCWLIGRTPWTAAFSRRLLSWSAAATIVTLTAVTVFVEGNNVRLGVTIISGALLAIWLIWQTPLDSTIGRRIAGYGAAAAVVLVAALVTYLFLRSAELPWEPFTRASLEDYRNKGHTVLVDFTADW